jgi:abortive infection bacteriophage resistance protein
MTKKPKSFEEQLEILESRNICINDKEYCRNILSRLNYYRLSAYMLPFKLNDEKYIKTDFVRIYNIYEFDMKLRSLLISVLEEIELLLRTKFAYYHAHKFGALGYLDGNNFNEKHNHEAFICEFQKIVNKTKDNLFVKHHFDKYNKQFPLWVAVELFPFGMLSRFYADMPIRDKKSIAKEFFGVGMEQLESWLICISTLRNRCAHYMRLYYYNFKKYPKMKKGDAIPKTQKIFDLIYIIRYCYCDNDKWEMSFIENLSTLIEQYSNDIDLEHIGFPDNWQERLTMLANETS